MSKQDIQKVILPVEIVNSVLQFLSKKPFEEVNQLINSIHQSAVAYKEEVPEVFETPTTPTSEKSKK